MPKYKKNVPTWAELRQFGCGWWLRNVQHLRNVMEKASFLFVVVEVYIGGNL